MIVIKQENLFEEDEQEYVVYDTVKETDVNEQTVYVKKRIGTYTKENLLYNINRLTDEITRYQTIISAMDSEEMIQTGTIKLPTADQRLDTFEPVLSSVVETLADIVGVE